MPVNSYSTGRDLILSIVAGGTRLQFQGLTSFRSKQDTIESVVTKIDGVNDHQRFFKGWSGSFMFERQSGLIDKYFNQLEANYYVGITENPVYIQEIVSENGGGFSKYLYEKVLLKLDDAGEWAGDKTVKQSISFIASRRKDQ